jgi:class 3 adenylate cyclase
MPGMASVLRNLSRRAKPFRYAGHFGSLLVLLLYGSAHRPDWRVGIAVTYCALWPILLDWLQRRNKAQAFTLRLHVAEGATSGILLGLLGLPIMPAAAVVTALLAGNAALAGSWLMCKVAGALGAGYLASAWGAANLTPGPSPAVWVAAILLAAYTVALGLASFAQAQRLHRVQLELQQRSELLNKLNQRLARYVPESLHARIVAEPHKRCPVERRWLTAAFVDCVGFTELADGLEAEAVAAILNDYFSALARVTDGCGGVLAKMHGDGALLYFSDDRQTRQRAALACARLVSALPELLASLSARWREDGYLVRLAVRAGIASGYCSLGDWGRERLDFTLIGAPVNLASRLQGQAIANGVLVSEVTAELLRREIPGGIGPAKSIRLKGLGSVVAHPLVDLPTLSANVPAA